MTMSLAAVQPVDNGGRRSGIERRRFSYSGVIPERRGGGDRRAGTDRRCNAERRRVPDRRRNDSLAKGGQADRRSGADRRNPLLPAAEANDMQMQGCVRTADSDPADSDSEPILLTDLVHCPLQGKGRETDGAHNTSLGAELEPLLLTDLVYTPKRRPRFRKRR